MQQWVTKTLSLTPNENFTEYNDLHPAQKSNENLSVLEQSVPTNINYNDVMPLWLFKCYLKK